MVFESSIIVNGEKNKFYSDIIHTINKQMKLILSNMTSSIQNFIIIKMTFSDKNIKKMKTT